MGHYPSSGQPYGPAGVEPFGPKGEPENLTDRGSASADGSAEHAAALKEFGGLKKGRRLGSVKNDGEKITVPLESQKPSTYNKPPVG